MTAIANRTVTTISKALEHYITKYRSHGFQTAFLDSDGGLIAVNGTYQLRGLKFTYASPG